MKNWCLARLNLSFLQSQQHIGDPTADRKRMSRLQALQGALQHVHLQRHVVHLPQKCLILLIPLNQPFGHLCQTQVIGLLQKHLPLNPWYPMCPEVQVEFHRVDADLSHLEAQGEATGPHSSHMRAQLVNSSFMSPPLLASYKND